MAHHERMEASIVIGSVLIIINHGDSITKGSYPPLWKILLTYSVPFLMSTWGYKPKKEARLNPEISLKYKKRLENHQSILSFS